MSPEIREEVLVVHRHDRLEVLHDCSMLNPRNGGSLYASAKWLRYCELTSGAGMTFLVARRGRQVVGLAPVRGIEPGKVLPLYDVASFLGENPPAVHPSVISAISGSAPPVLTAPHCSPAEVAEIHRAIGRELRRHATDQRARTYGALYLRNRDFASYLADDWPATTRTFLADAHAVLDAPFDSFEQYLSILSRNRRTGVRRERREFLSSGLTIAITQGPDALDAETARLQINLRHKYGVGGTIDQVMTDYDRLAQTVGEHLVIVRCEASEEPIGLALMLLDGSRLHCRLVGFDYEKLSAAFVYFNVVFYEPIAWGLANGISSYNFGPGTYAAKRARGCVLEPLWGVVDWGPTAAAPLDAKLAEYEESLTRELGLVRQPEQA